MSTFLPPLAPQRSGSFPRLLSLVPSPSPLSLDSNGNGNGGLSLHLQQQQQQQSPRAPPSVMPPLERATTEQVAAVFSPQQHQMDYFASSPSSAVLKLEHHHSHQEHALVCMSDELPPVLDTSCPQCLSEAQLCAACAKQQYFFNGWPIDLASLSHQQQQYSTFLPLSAASSPATVAMKQPPEHDGDETMGNTLPPQLLSSSSMTSTASSGLPPVNTEAMHEEKEAEEEKTALHAELPPVTQASQKQQQPKQTGKLARFLPGEMVGSYSGMEPLKLPAQMASSASFASSDDHKTAAAAPTSRSGRSLRQRKVRSRSPSPDLSDLSSFASASDTEGGEDDHDTDQYEDDSISPPPGAAAASRGYGIVDAAGDSSGQSSAEPPAPTSLLPVSSSALLPSRPSTAAVPPAHIKDRLVNSAKKLLTAADGVNASVQVQVIPIWYPRKPHSAAEATAAAAQQTPNSNLPHKIRLIRVYNTDTQQVSMYAHAADVGGVVERKSNISRLFGKFESPAEKLLMNVCGAHNHVTGQESNILTSKGVRKFLSTNKMKDQPAYRHWIQTVMLPKLMHDPLEIGEELLEIEASTDPRAPSTVKPLRMRRNEKKKQQALKGSDKDASAQPAAKKQKTVHLRTLLSPPGPTSASAASSPSHASGASSSASSPSNQPASSTAVQTPGFKPVQMTQQHGAMPSHAA
jgi:hypothetical protein